MTSPTGHQYEHKSSDAKAEQDTIQTEQSDRIVMYTIISLLAFSVGVGIAVGFLPGAYHGGNRIALIYCITGIVVFAAIGSGAALIALGGSDKAEAPAPVGGTQADAPTESGDSQSDRAWIRVHLTPESLTTSDTEGFVITSRVTVKNVGKAVAGQVIIWDYLASDLSTLADEQEKLRANFDRPQLIKNIGGITIFPDEERSEIHTVGTGKEPPQNYWHKMMPDMLDRDVGDRILPLTYIGCVGYRSGTSDKWHFTYWAYDLVTADGRHLPLRIATGKLPQPPYLRETVMGNLNRVN